MEEWKNGRLEERNNGRMEYWGNSVRSLKEVYPLFQYSSIPIFQFSVRYSNIPQVSVL
jgi:hypothetical protein